MFEALTALLDKNLPFVVFRKPYSKEIQLYFQEDDQLHLTEDFSESGFIMAPFISTDFYSYIPKKNNQIFPLEENKTLHKTDVLIKDRNERPFISLVQKGLDEFKNTILKKVVLSHAIKIEVKKSDSKQTFKNLTQLYPTAFVYYWHHPSTGSWMGATPECFASFQNNKLHTIALAGTSLVDEGFEAEWSSKEIKEQQLVTDSIDRSLKSIFPKATVTVGEVSSVRAGALWHLKTDVVIESTELSLSGIIKALHPTPAVGGVPKKKSIDFILKNEDYDRKFYTGFLGLFDSKLMADLYVNLRCAEITPLGYTLYVGAGITPQSDPIKEWEETQRKAETFCRAL